MGVESGSYILIYSTRISAKPKALICSYILFNANILLQDARSNIFYYILISRAPEPLLYYIMFALRAAEALLYYNIWDRRVYVPGTRGGSYNKVKPIRKVGSPHLHCTRFATACQWDNYHPLCSALIIY